MDLDLNKIKKVYFIGIGGIGVSAIARLMVEKGKKVVGCDRDASLVTDMLAKIGAEIKIGHDAENLSEDTDLVVYTIAIEEDNPEFVKAKELGIPMKSYPEMLGILSRDKYTIAVSGTHGKTTTTAMIGKILVDSEMDPTIIVGSLMKGPMSNLVVGASEYFVVEACEYRRSFLNLHPNILVITNIDNDHLDYYKDIEDIKSAFEELASRLRPKDYLVCNLNDERLKSIVENLNCIIVDYSKNELASKLKLKVVGKHNVENAKAALSVAEILKLDAENSCKMLEDFSGTWRRFEYKGKTKGGTMVYDDYAHHPTEIRATLVGARQYFIDKKIAVAFQPHLYSRTKLLLDDFSKSFEEVDMVMLSDIYAAREPKDESINSEILAEEINRHSKRGKPADISHGEIFADKAIYTGDLKNTEKYLKENADKFDVIITMGAGSISLVSDEIINN